MRRTVIGLLFVVAAVAVILVVVFLLFGTANESGGGLPSTPARPR